MTTPAPRRAPLARAAMLAVILGLLAAGGYYGASQHAAPARCASGSTPAGAYCCGNSQTLVNGQCSGVATACPASQVLQDGTCAFLPRRVRIPAGKLSLSATDWEESAPRSRILEPVAEFWIDASEVTIGQWLACTENGSCPELPAAVANPNLPIVNLSPAFSAAYCHAHGGNLPTAIQWVYAAAGASGNRYPWGQTGLVCRRAAYALVDGPCATGALHAEAVASRPDGASPLGVFDLVGNVAEWTRDGSTYSARGGSFRSVLAGTLKVWSTEATDAPRDDIGFRCVYPHPR